MSRRCCCGKVQIEDDEAGVIHNDYGHEPLGPVGNFCGPAYKHELRDLRSRVAELEREKNHVKAEAEGYLSTAMKWQDAAHARETERDGIEAVLRVSQELVASNRDKRLALEDRVAELEREVEMLRRYGNKDCTAMADAALANPSYQPKGEP